MEIRALAEACNSALKTMWVDHPTDGHTMQITQDLVQMDLTHILDGVGVVIQQHFVEAIREKGGEPHPVDVAMFIRDSSFVIAVAAGYKLGHVAATEMFYETSQSIAELPTTQEEGEPNGSTD